MVIDENQWGDYRSQLFETGWQSAWEETGICRALDESDKPEFCCLDFFPYPSGEGLHVGHYRIHLPTDVLSPCKRMRGFYLLHPIGWIVLGDLAGQYAVRRGVHPRLKTDANKANCKRQMKFIGTR